MRKLILVLMLMGVSTLEAKPRYRIETWLEGNQRFYQPQQRVWYKTNYFYLPFKVWVSSAHPFQNKSEAEEIIKNWKVDFEAKKNYRKSEYIIVN